MTAPVTTPLFDQAIEEQGMRKQGMLGRGTGMGNALFSIDYDRLPPEARTTIGLIVADGPFPYPGKDGSYFGNGFGDLPTGRYLEYTVPTPGVTNRGARRIVARCTTGQLFSRRATTSAFRFRGEPSPNESRRASPRPMPSMPSGGTDSTS